MDYEEIRKKIDDDNIKSRSSSNESEGEKNGFVPPYRSESLLKKIDGMSWKQLIVIQQLIGLAVATIIGLGIVSFLIWGMVHAF